MNDGARHFFRRHRAPHNVAPSQWGRRLARLVGAKYGVQMSQNWSKNEGVIGGKTVVIKCAKSTVPPVTVLISMLERLDDLWAVYLMPDGGAELWVVPIDAVRQYGYWTHGANVRHRIELSRRKVVRLGYLKGMLLPHEVESCDIP